MDLLKLQYSFNKDVIFREVAGTDSCIIMAHNVKTGDMYEFNDVGSDLFLLIKDNVPVDRMMEILTQEYEVSSDEIMEDVTAFINRFIELGIINVK